MVEGLSGVTKVQLFISCRKLADVERLSKSDPFVEVFEKTHQSDWVKIGQTEVIWDNLNPDFIKNFVIDYCFEVQKFLMFKVFDANMEGKREVKGQAIGEVECTLGEILGSKGQQVIKTLRLPKNTKRRGNIVLRAEQVAYDNNEDIKIVFSGKDLENRNNPCFCHVTCPMFYLSRVMENGPNQRVYSSEFEVGFNVNWKQVSITTQDLCNCDHSRPVCFELYDYYSNGNHKFIGNFEFSIQKITEGGQRQFEVIDPRRKSKQNYKNSGHIIISLIDISKKYSFLEYIAGGCEISLLIAIDFTASNGDPTDPNSLHYLNPNGYNQYQSALHSVSEILLNYDSDKKVPVYGFGGNINSQINHCFPLNFNPNNPEVNGLQGIMEAYSSSLSRVELNGPTLFGRILENAVKIAEESVESQSEQHYFILLILTDGEIHDMHIARNLIVRGSFAPLSIIIVGIGEADFTNMEILDADDKALVDSEGRKMIRDIVQFVPYRKFSNSAFELAKEVLEEVPREIVNFFKGKGIFPNPKISAPEYEHMKTISQNTYEEEPEIIVPSDVGNNNYAQKGPYSMGYGYNPLPTSPNGFNTFSQGK